MIFRTLLVVVSDLIRLIGTLRIYSIRQQQNMPFIAELFYTMAFIVVLAISISLGFLESAISHFSIFHNYLRGIYRYYMIVIRALCKSLNSLLLTGIWAKDFFIRC